MSGDTWVALDGRDANTFTGTCWISDAGAYIGPVPGTLLANSAWLPLTAAEVQYLIVPANPDGHDDHVLGSGSYAYTVVNDYEQQYFPSSSPTYSGDPSAFDAGARLFVVYSVTGIGSSADPATLPTLTDSPLDLCPVGWVAGGRLDLSPPATGPADLDVLSFGLYDTDGTWIGPLVNVQGGSWQHELSAPGSLTCKVAESDPHYADLLPKRIIKAFWRGACRMAARIDSSSVDLAQDGTRWREFNQLPGALNMLADGIVYPQADDIAGAWNNQRWFGYMSKAGAWYDSSDWAAPTGITWAAMTGVRAGKPEGLDYPNPSWIAVNGPNTDEAPGTVQYFRKSFTLVDPIDYQILATADNDLTLWLDGEQLVSPDQQEGVSWQFLVQITGTLGAGTHELAAKVGNAYRSWKPASPMGLILTLQRLHANGDVYVETPIVNTNASWLATAAAVGFRRNDVIATIFDEAAARNTAGAYINAFQIMAYDFTHTLDSDGGAWTAALGEHALDVRSMTVLDAIQQLAEKDIDVDMDFGAIPMVLKVYNRKGSDLSGTITLTVGESLKQDRVDRVEAKFNTALIQKADGSFVEVHDAASTGLYGRIETGLEIGTTSDTTTAQAVAQAAFTESADTSYTFTVATSTLVGPQVYVDYDIGDSVTLVDDEGTSRKVRVLAVTVDVSSDVPATTLEVTVDRS